MLDVIPAFWVCFYTLKNLNSPRMILFCFLTLRKIQAAALTRFHLYVAGQTLCIAVI